MVPVSTRRIEKEKAKIILVSSALEMVSSFVRPVVILLGVVRLLVLVAKISYRETNGCFVGSWR